MKTLNSIKTGLICTASFITIACLIGYLFVGAWYLLLIAIFSCVLGLTLKEDE
ncbi:MAG TPA: hypothetical protein GXZ87_07500 [Bacteroidales bacterium]|nr:hypothetical protein [Bacteroidales bacterium]